jgi:Carbohydrate esterase, sialic acid-specific acetylesterase/Fibronectin type III domain
MGILDAPTIGVNRNDVGADGVLILGQSNATANGQGADYTYLDAPDPRVLQWPMSGTLAGNAVQATEPLLEISPWAASNLRAGLGLALGKRLAQRAPVNRSICLIPAARGSTGFTTSSVDPPPSGTHVGAGSWKVGAGGVNYLDNAIAAVQAWAAAGTNRRLVAAVWVQGEEDAGILSQSQYAAELDALIDSLRTRVSLPALPFIVGQMVPTWAAANATAVNAAHIDTPRRKASTWFVYGPSGFVNSPDDIHYSSEGKRRLGRLLADAIPYAQANVTGVAPLAPAAPALKQSATSLAISWDRPKCRVTDYSVQWRVGTTGSWTTISRGANNIDNTASLTGLTRGDTIQARVATINEAGTSAYAQSQIVLAQTPGQVTGLAAGTAAGSTQPLTWTAVAAATSYLVEYKTNASGTWLTSQTVSTTSATVTGLLGEVSYDYRVTAISDGGTGTASATVTATSAPAGSIIGEVGVSAAWLVGLRKLRNGHTGAAIRVRRSSDNAEADIGFTGTGALDTTALLAHVGSGSGYLAKWYDQSGNGRDFVQASTAQQPRIVNSGVVDTHSGNKPGVFFGGEQWMAWAGTALVGGHTAISVSQPTSGDSVVFADRNNAGNARIMQYWLSSPLLPQAEVRNDANTQLTSIGGLSSGVASGAVHQHTSSDDLSKIVMSVDSTGGLATNYTRSGAFANNQTVLGSLLGSSTGSNQMKGYIAEVSAWAQLLATDLILAAERNAKSANGTP